MALSNAGVASLAGAGRLTELRQRIFFVIMVLVVYRIGTFIPLPGIDVDVMRTLFTQHSGGILGMMNMFSGGALSRMSLFALGVMPYISASIIVQLLSSVLPSLERIKKEGEAGRRKITQYTRYGTLALGLVQALGVSIALQGQSVGGQSLVYTPGFGFLFVATMTLLTGTMLLVWLGEQITERGVGNGISLIIFAGIVAGLPTAIGGTAELVRTGELGLITLLILAVLIVAVTAFVVFVERGQRRITVNYARRQQGRGMSGQQSSHLPLKLNMAGVIPPIFASSIILFPATLGNWLGQQENMAWLRNLSTALSPGQPLYVGLYAAAIIFFCFFYTALVFNSRETADNLKRSGAFVPGIRPGEHTARYIDKVLTRLTFWGALYITAVCLLPEFLILYWNVPFYFGGTSLLIIVVVLMDFMAQVQSHLVSHQYDSLVRKAHFKSGL
ncbi:MAG: preprotein translocase subunit SecY [Halothiobacillus sp. 14-56-357]|uniref:preprotein translocase subunit SecY n=1 Tax=Halothiobacillus sp. 15-55-196 TaxID=1970382 RepID=UPI000BC5E81A|nr:preprotein translocase subunit SecY [Halothiobacillus sp. 15-55-196]OZB36388.1 MAG: preprotein translocase subunit SecY [Halothiobacillus sp. 15-55-196]OZB55224.1 MAG: preprotein translocase subunit SecY [Halothiobacillus sp. 14-56-357]OZB76821.1 MAG: preprotein translocase subunit SecY [Halothiobacillus sp. 13-55-115]